MLCERTVNVYFIAVVVFFSLGSYVLFFIDLYFFLCFFGVFLYYISVKKFSGGGHITGTPSGFSFYFPGCDFSGYTQKKSFPFAWVCYPGWLNGITIPIKCTAITLILCCVDIF